MEKKLYTWKIDNLEPKNLGGALFFPSTLLQTLAIDAVEAREKIAAFVLVMDDHEPCREPLLKFLKDNEPSVTNISNESWILQLTASEGQPHGG